jgi:hypothetical protein
MEETTITATELSRNMSDVLNRMRYKGERFKVMRNGEVIGHLEPEPQHRKVTLGEFVSILRSAPRPDSDYWDDVEEAHRSMNQPVDPPSWDC